MIAPGRSFPRHVDDDGRAYANFRLSTVQ